MSHFLSRLVQRTRGEVATVRPASHAVTAPDPGATAWDEQVMVRETPPLAQSAHTARLDPPPSPAGVSSREATVRGDAVDAWVAPPNPAAEPELVAPDRRPTENAERAVIRESSTNAFDGERTTSARPGAALLVDPAGEAPPFREVMVASSRSPASDGEPLVPPAITAPQLPAPPERPAPPAPIAGFVHGAPVLRRAVSTTGPRGVAVEASVPPAAPTRPAGPAGDVVPQTAHAQVVARERMSALPHPAGDAIDVARSSPAQGPIATVAPLRERSGETQRAGAGSTVIAPALPAPPGGRTVAQAGQLAAPLLPARKGGAAAEVSVRDGAARRAQPSREPAVREAATTVEVSIGRIEIRLPQPPRAAARDAVSSPRRAVVGLAEYLRARDTGKQS